MRENGVPRAEMPQIPREHLNTFQDRLRAAGHAFAPDSVDPQTLSATQSELNGTAVGDMIKATQAGTMNLTDKPIWISSDGYVLDGHHRWAAASAISANCGGCLQLPVVRVDMPMSDLLAFANDFNDEMGIQRRAFGEPDEEPAVAAAAVEYFEMATDTEDGIDDADLANLAHGDGSAFV